MRKKKVKNMKKLFGTKGQGAMEYLMTYGWAILVVMIVGIAMWQLGIFNIGGTTVTSTGFARIKPQLAAVSLDTDGNLVTVFTNGVGARIVITDVNIVDNDATGTPTICGATLSTNINIAGNLNPAAFGGAGTGVGVGVGDNFQVILDDCDVTGNVGDVFNIRVDIEYTVVIGGIESDHVDSGNFRGPLS